MTNDRKRRLNNIAKKSNRAAMFETLERRELFAIDLIGTELRITGSGLDDWVSIGYSPRLTGQIVATRTEIAAEGQTTESKTFPVTSIGLVRVVLGNGNNQFLNQTSLPSRVFGGTGMDVMTGGAGVDQFYGYASNDQLKGNGGNDLLDGSDGTDVLEGGDGDDAMNGGEGNDTLRGELGNDSIQGGGGDDLAIGGDGIDQIRGNDGKDRLQGGPGNDSLYGDAGDDILEGEAGLDTLYGGLGLDKLLGGADNDALYGEADADELFGGLGSDKVFGGDGNDKLYGNVKTSTDTSADSGNTLRGGNGNDQIYASAGNDLIYGEAGNDYLRAGAGNDQIWGGPDHDLILAGDGTDQAYGDDGDDIVQGGQGNDRVDGGIGNDVLAANLVFVNILDAGIEVDDADTANNVLVGGPGNDRLYGSNQIDMLSGNDGDDWINAMAGDDQVFGGNGNDVLLGGSGLDRLDGGLDKDRIVAMDTAADVIVPQPSGSTIVERDEVWVDAADLLANATAILKVQNQFSDAVHIVGQYRTYDAFGTFETTPPMAWGMDSLIDPDARVQHQDAELSKADFGSSPLFGPNGPVWNDIDQGSVGTCYFLSRLAALAKTHPQHIRDMVTELGDGTFVVQFLNQEGERVFVRVDGDLYRKNGNILYAERGTGDSMWVAIVEKAWAIHRYGYATYDSISGGNGTVNDDRTENAIALGIEDTKIYQTLYRTPQVFANTLKTMLDSGRGVVFGGRSFIDDNMAMVPANYRSGEHILMLHSVDTNAAGDVIKIRYYDLYGGPLKEMSNLEVFFYGCGGITAFKPL